MPIQHVFEKVTQIKAVDSVTHITLEDGTVLSLPPAAIDDASKIHVGDKALLDFEVWEDGLGMAFVKILRKHYTIWDLSVGGEHISNCSALTG